VQAYASHKAGQAEGRIAGENARLAILQGQDAVSRGAIEAGAIRSAGYATANRALAGVAASGVETTTGSPANIFSSSIVNAERDASTAMANAVREAWGFRVEAQNYQAQAKRARRTGVLGAIGAGISGIGSAAGAYSSWGGMGSGSGSGGNG
jgi:hypothetical protein